MIERGQGGDLERFSKKQNDEARHEHAKAVLGDQRASLEQWVDYFASPDSGTIPTAFKYWVLREVTKLKEYDKDKKVFPARSKGTVAQFPDLNHEGLAYIIDAVSKHLQGIGVEFEHDIQDEESKIFLDALKKEDFAKLYAWANELMHPIPEHLLPTTEGDWVYYAQGSDHMPLVESVRGKGTGWCTAGEQTAKGQLAGGGFWLYKTLDDDGNATIPRLAIRMEGDAIAEVRGIAKKQNVDEFMSEVLRNKLQEMPGGAIYLKRTDDMDHMKVIETKQKAHEPLTQEDLRFIYELDAKIEGFGYVRGTRIQKIREGRNVEVDMLVVFECTTEQIAHSVREINEDTKAYVGKLEPGIFDRLPESVEYIFAKFPEGQVRRYSIEIGGKDEHELVVLLERNGYSYNGAKWMLEHDDFKRSVRESDSKQPDWKKWKLKSPEEATLILLRVKDLGFRDATIDQIYARAQELGLELCPPEVGPLFRLGYTNQPVNKDVFVGMKPIYDGVFMIQCPGDGSGLSTHEIEPNTMLFASDLFIFRLRKKPLNL